MRRVALILLGLAILSPAAAENCCPPGQVCPTRPPVASTTHPAIVRVITTTQRGSWLGTGVLVRPPRECEFGVVLTANHGLPPRLDNVVVVSSNRRVTARILGRDSALDLAVLSIPKPSTKPYKIATELPRIGDVLWAGGYAGPEGYFQIASGRLQQFVTPEKPIGPKHSVLMFGGSVAMGVSGGVISNSDGRLVGIVSSSDHEFVFGTHCVHILKFLDRILAPVPMTPMVPPPVGRLPPLPPPTSSPVSPVASATISIDAPSNVLVDVSPDVQTVPPIDVLTADPIGDLIDVPADAPVDVPVDAPVDTQVEAVDQRETAIWADIVQAVAANDRRFGAIEDRFKTMTEGTQEQMEATTAKKSMLGTALPGILTALAWSSPPSVLALLAARFGLAAWRRRRAGKGLTHAHGDSRKGESSSKSPPAYRSYAQSQADIYTSQGSRDSLWDQTLGRLFDLETESLLNSQDDQVREVVVRLRDTIFQNTRRQFTKGAERTSIPA